MEFNSAQTLWQLNCIPVFDRLLQIGQRQKLSLVFDANYLSVSPVEHGEGPVLAKFILDSPGRLIVHLGARGWHRA